MLSYPLTDLDIRIGRASGRCFGEILAMSDENREQRLRLVVRQLEIDEADATVGGSRTGLSCL